MDTLIVFVRISQSCLDLGGLFANSQTGIREELDKI